MSENVTSSPSSADLIQTYARLGFTSFGGPVAHIGYYRDAFITKTGWMDDEAFAERLALCQALPGPTSSQMAFACAWKMSSSLGTAFLCLSLFLIPSMVILLALGLFFVAAVCLLYCSTVVGNNVSGRVLLHCQEQDALVHEPGRFDVFFKSNNLNIFLLSSIMKRKKNYFNQNTEGN